MTTSDSNGIIRWESTDSVTPLEATLNAGMDSVSAAITGVKNGIIYFVANTTARAAKAAEFAPTATKPLYVHRGDAPANLRLEYTTDGITWGNVSTWLPKWGIERYRSTILGAGGGFAPVKFNQTRRYNAGAVPSDWGLAAWTTDSDTLTAPATGWYSFNASVRVDTAPTATAVNFQAGTEVSSAYNASSNTSLISTNGEFYAVAGAALKVNYYSNSGTTIQPDNATDGNVRTYLRIRYLGE